MTHRSSLMILIAALVLMTASVVFAATPALTGTWKISVPSKSASGEPCPFVPDGIQFFKDQTVSLSNIGNQRLPYKTELSAAEKKAIETRIPEFKGKNILLIKLAPNMEWTATPMAYAYTITKGELTLILKGWSPATFVQK